MPVTASSIGARRSFADSAVAAAARTSASDLAWLLPVLAVTAAVLVVGLEGNPQRIDDEGTYAAQAWSVFHLGGLTHYTYWYDHPPLGWIQIALYTEATGAWVRHATAVGAAREAMVVFAVASAALLYVLARKLHVSRPAAAAAVLVFALSPLAVQYHRDVYIDNVATPWLLAAFVLAVSRHHQLVEFAGSAACMVAAVLSKETFLLALPFLAWTMWRSAHPEIRRYTLSVAAVVLALGGSSYLVFAATKGELVPGPGHVSLWQGVTFQLGDRSGSGSVFDPATPANHVVSLWLGLDPAFVALGVVASVAALAVPRLRSVAAVAVFLIAVVLRPNGYLPVPYPIAILPFAALAIAGVSDVLVRAVVDAVRRARLARASGEPSGRPGRLVVSVVGLTVWSVAAVGVVGAAAPASAARLGSFMTTSADAPMLGAQDWITANVSRSDRLLVDDALWVDLVRAGFPRQNVIWYYKLSTDSAVARQNPSGWRDADYIVTTQSVAIGATQLPGIQAALRASAPVAVFGEGGEQVVVRRIDRQGAEHLRAGAERAAATRERVGTELVGNPALRASDDQTALLRSGGVDERATVGIGAVLAAGPVTLTALPVVPGEQETARRGVVLQATNTAAAEQAEMRLRGLEGALAPDRVHRRGTEVAATWSPNDPAGPGVLRGGTGRAG
ncbi:glycosyltransferase [Curtobacterium sp. MCPF17_046]|nr:glycosyltransferase [Curtobacterium sp. MCPF17_046]